MSENLHTVAMSGRLGRDPETKELGGNTKLELNVAVNHRAKVDGKYDDVTNWYRVSTWGKRAESLGKLLHKGDFVEFTGKLEPRKYVGKNGEQLSLDVNDADILLVPTGGKRDAERNAEPRRAAQFSRPPEQDDTPDGFPDDSTPF